MSETNQENRKIKGKKVKDIKQSDSKKEYNEFINTKEKDLKIEVMNIPKIDNSKEENINKF